MPTLPDRIENFIAWLDAELDRRHITDAVLARRAGINQSVISRARSGDLPGFKSCLAIGIGLNVPPEIVLRAAGHLPPLPVSDTIQLELVSILSNATDQQRREILRYARYVIETDK